jgi:decaprenylphospho-beta-D-ribofuranose 2-oxidase
VVQATIAAAPRAPALLSGWGRTSPTQATLVRPRTAEEVSQALEDSIADRGGLIARGAGRSYGDAAQNGGGTVVDARGLCGVLELDQASGLVRAGAGTTLAQLLLFLAPRGLTLPVVPGTRHVTIGGAIACDVHGKNHPADGSFGRHVHSLRLCTPAEGTVEVSAEHEPELFEGTLGGIGLTGIVLDATLQAMPMRTPLALADIDRTDDLEGALALMAADRSHRYSIAWIDLMARGSRFGRSVLTRSEEGPVSIKAPRRLRATGGRAAPFSVRPAVSVPRGFPYRLLNAETVRAFNAVHWRSAPAHARDRTLTMSAQLFPLDTIGAWNRLYGPAGLIQYQFALPSGQERALLDVLVLLRASAVPIYLAVLKRFGPSSSGLLSFPLEGWTIALDIPGATPGLAGVLDRADELVAGAGGRVYLAKDARLSGQMLRRMYPGLERFNELRARVDPDGRLRSDMARRLDLC